MVKDHSDSERKPTATTWATLSNQQQGFFYMHHSTDRIAHLLHQSWSTGWKVFLNDIKQSYLLILTELHPLFILLIVSFNLSDFANFLLFQQRLCDK